MRCIFTNRTIGMTSFSIGADRTIGPSIWRIVSVCVYWTWVGGGVNRQTTLPGVVLFLCWIGKCDILYQLICRGKTTGLSSEPARWSCDNCQRMSDFDSCQSNRTHTDGLHNWKASQVVQDLLWHLTLAYMRCVYGWAGVRYVMTKFSRMDGLPNFVTHGAPVRALRARELRYNRSWSSLDLLVSNPLNDFYCYTSTLIHNVSFNATLFFMHR